MTRSELKVNQEEVVTRLEMEAPKILEKIEETETEGWSQNVIEELARGLECLKESEKEAWIEALTSENYEQGTSRLRSQDDKFCCLGVACDLKTNGHHWDKQRVNASDTSLTYYFVTEEGEKRDGIWPNGFSEEYAKKGRADDLDHAQDGLVALNDNGFTFEEIAEILRIIF